VRKPLAAFVLVLVFVAAVRVVELAGQKPRLLDMPPYSIAFAVIGDSGTGNQPQYEVAQQMAAAHESFPFETVIMLGDNIYGAHNPEDYAQKFERPYKLLLDGGVRFYAALGNHDDKASRFYKPFNMGGERYYTYAIRSVRFFALDSDFLDAKQRVWIEAALKDSHDAWKICYFHHPLYSDGRTHGSEVELRVVLEPLFVKYGVQIVFSGHDHVYERVKPQKGIQYFVSGAAGELRKGDVRWSEMTATAFDQDRSFMLVDIAGDQMMFEAISRTGRIVDSGIVEREATQITHR
jgi:3',5'-cyclic AMP phosphodiesterase CpdA